MKYKARFLYLARQDLREIINYLDREASPEIRKAFAEQFGEQLKAAEDYPGINGVYLGNPQYRRLVVQNYSYCAYYKIDEQNKIINIYRVLHTARDIDQLIP